MSDWVVIEIACDGDSARHDPESVARYRRIVDKSDGSHVWAPQYSATMPGRFLDNQRVWLDAANTPAEDRKAMAEALENGAFTRRAHETFTCPVCGFNIPAKWETVEKLLDGLYRMPMPRAMLREFDSWLKSGWLK